MNKLTAAMQERQGDMSLRAVARDLGVAVGTAEGWLKGWRSPKLENVPAIALWLGIEVDQVVHWLIEDLELPAAAKGVYLPSAGMAADFREAA